MPNASPPILVLSKEYIASCPIREVLVVGSGKNNDPSGTKIPGIILGDVVICGDISKGVITKYIDPIVGGLFQFAFWCPPHTPENAYRTVCDLERASIDVHGTLQIYGYIVPYSVDLMDCVRERFRTNH